MNSDIEEIKSRLNAADVIGEYIRLEKAGANYKAHCPFHNEKTPSFMVSAEKQIWHCFGCQKGGDIFAFVMEMEGLEFKEALKLLADKAGVPLRRFDAQAEGKKNRTLEILELATKFYETQLWQGAGKIKIINYLKERGLKEETIRQFRLGYAPLGWRNILQFLLNRGYSIEEIKKTGLLVEKQAAQISKSQIPNPKQIPNSNDQNTNLNTTNYQPQATSYYDRFRDRIIFPIADIMGKVVGFSARVAPGGDESQAKYVNTPESEVYHKSKVLYGADKAKGEIKSQDFVLLVEGNMDVIAAAQAGIKNTVAVSGTALTAEQVNIIKRYTNNLRMFFDMDKAGEEATKKSLKLCFERDLNVKVVELPEGKDAAELARRNPTLLKETVEKAADALEYFFQKVFSKENPKEVEGKKKIAAEILDMLSHVSSEIAKGHWLKKLAAELDTQETVLTDMLKKVTLKDRAAKDLPAEKSADAYFSSENKLETLVQELIGLMLIYESVWRKAAAEEKNNPFLVKNSLLGSMLGQGEKFQFSFDNLVKKLEITEEASLAEKIYFKKRYRLDLNNNIEEIFLNDPLAEYAKCLKEIRKELTKNELEKIAKDLAIAEKNSDQEAVVFLREEVKRISAKLAD